MIKPTEASMIVDMLRLEFFITHAKAIKAGKMSVAKNSILLSSELLALSM